MLNPVLKFTMLGFAVNGALDRGQSLDLDETRGHIHDGSIFDWLGDQLGDLWSFTAVLTVVEWVDMLDFFQGLTGAVNADKKFGVAHNGLALIGAYCIEGVQQLSGPAATPDEPDAT